MAGWPEHGCVGCSFMADHVPHLAHLNARDTTLVYASRAPQPDIHRLKARMGWEHIPWYTFTDDFDADFGVDEWHGRTPSSATATGSSAPTSSTAAATSWRRTRGATSISPLGRQEDWEDSPDGYPQTPPYAWWKWHDAYDAEASQDHLEQIARAIASRESADVTFAQAGGVPIPAER